MTLAQNVLSRGRNGLKIGWKQNFWGEGECNVDPRKTQQNSVIVTLGTPKIINLLVKTGKTGLKARPQRKIRSNMRNVSKAKAFPAELKKQQHRKTQKMALCPHAPVIDRILCESNTWVSNQVLHHHAILSHPETSSFNNPSIPLPYHAPPAMKNSDTQLPVPH